MRYYVLSDVHGFYSLMIRTLCEKGYFDDPLPHKLIICGDLFDRGNEAEEMQRFIADMLEKDEIILVRGNHEDLIEDLAENIDEYVYSGIETSHHMYNGTVNTLLSLTAASMPALKLFPKSVGRQLRALPLFRKILPAMLDYYETEHYIFLHGWLPCKIEEGMAGKTYRYLPDWRHASKSDWIRARWINGMDASDPDFGGVLEPNKTVVCGHYACSYGHIRREGGGDEKAKERSIFSADADFSPFYASGIIAMDASTANSRKMNCLILED